MDRNRISAIVTCRNAEDTIEGCLSSLRGFGEIIVVDSFSTDRTMELARGHPVVIYRRPYESAAKQKNWALEQTGNDWVLVLDSDERLSAEVREEIELLDEHPGEEGFWIRRSSSFLGKRISHCGWQRDRVLRLFKKSRGAYEEREVHEEVTVRGMVGSLKGRILHDPYRDMRDYLRKMEEYTSRGARDFLIGGGRFPTVRMLLHPPFRFVRMFLLQLGFMDGHRGLLLCVLSSYGVFLKYAKARRSRV